MNLGRNSLLLWQSRACMCLIILDLTSLQVHRTSCRRWESNEGFTASVQVNLYLFTLLYIYMHIVEFFAYKPSEFNVQHDKGKD